MKVFVANDARPQQGGGFSFLASFRRGMGDLVTDDYDEADIVFIAGASLCKPEVAKKAHQDGKRVVLRTDNALRHSRNGGRGMARMQRMAAVADLVVYQCRWARSYLDSFLEHPNSTIIYNGVDLNIFRPDGDSISFDASPVYLYASAAKGENKGWDMAWYHYQEVQHQQPNAMMLIAGKVSTEVMNNGFDFFQGERYKYLGMITTPQDMARIYRSADFFYGTATYECYSNALLEALACGLEPICISQEGGTPELLDNWHYSGREFNGLDRMVADYRREFDKL